MDPIKVCLIGTGNIFNCHINSYLKLPNVKVVAICDIDENKMKTAAERYKVEHTYTDYREMLASEKPDCVSVCTWNKEHKNAAIAALRAGANVLCEKPMAMNAQEAKEMEEVAKETGKLLQIGFVRRFGDDANCVASLRNNGYLGDIYYAKATYLRRNGCPGGWFRDKEFSGGGPLIDLGVHVIDLVRYLAGNPKPTAVFGVTYDNLGPNRASGGEKAWEIGGDGHPYTVEDFVSAMIRFDNGLTLQVESSFNLNVKGDSGKIELFGTKAGVCINPNVEMYTDMAGMFVDVAPHGDTYFHFGKAFDAEIKGFVDAATGVAPCRATAEDGVVLMKIVDAIYASAASGKSVDIQW